MASDCGPAIAQCETVIALQAATMTACKKDYHRMEPKLWRRGEKRRLNGE
jgi:hypothetical protein